jgi:hypothetical protein
MPPPRLARASGWLSVTTGPTDPSVLAPQVWAITERSNLSALRPFDLFNGLRSLKPKDAVIWASTAGRGAPTATFVPAALPLRLLQFRLDRLWEGQPAPNVQQRLRWVAVQQWRLDVRVYFGTQHPSPALLKRTQAELNRLKLP